MKNSMFVFVLAVLAASSAFAATAPGGGSFPVSCSISPSSVSIKAGTSQSLSVSCSDTNGASIACPPMGWSTTIGSMAASPSADSTTFSAGTSVGSGTITAMAPPLSQPTFSCTASATVTPGDPSSLSVSPKQITLNSGATQQFTAQLYDQYGNPISSAAAASQFRWMADASIGKIDSGGTFSATGSGMGKVTAIYDDTPSLQGIRGSADVSVVFVPSTKFCTLDPSAASVAAGQKQVFSATCYSDDPRKMGPKSTEIACPAILWLSTGGKITANPAPSVISPSATFTAPAEAGTVTITAYEDTPLASPMAGMQCQASAEITAGAPLTVAISPTSSSLIVGDTQQFSATAWDQYGNMVSNAAYLWSTTGSIGAVDKTGQFSATAAGSGTVRVDIDCPSAALLGCPHDSAEVTVSASSSGGNGGTGGNGGSGGSGNGGGSFASSSAITYTCAGKPGTLSVQIFQSGASALAEIFFMDGIGHPKVLSVSANSNQQVAFNPDKAGNYELRVSVGTEQRTADFSVPACTPQNQNATNTVDIKLQQPAKPVVTPTPKPVPTPVPSQPSQEQGSIPLYLLIGAAVLILAGAYFVLFGQKKNP